MASRTASRSEAIRADAPSLSFACPRPRGQVPRCCFPTPRAAATRRRSGVGHPGPQLRFVRFGLTDLQARAAPRDLRDGCESKALLHLPRLVAGNVA